jgi:putative restriction endonuclease
VTTSQTLQQLPSRHQAALAWFKSNRGNIVGWPAPLSDGTLLACRPKGIYKPAWSTYALSIREMMSRPYPDEKPKRQPNGRWTYRYFQENIDPTARDDEFTNRALLKNIADGVPVGVMRQVAVTPRSQYEILGIARVKRWKTGYFLLEGMP